MGHPVLCEGAKILPEQRRIGVIVDMPVKMHRAPELVLPVGNGVVTEHHLRILIADDRIIADPTEGVPHEVGRLVVVAEDEEFASAEL